MGGSRVSENLVIQSHNGPYRVFFEDNCLINLNSNIPENAHFIIDQNLANLYTDQMRNILNYHSTLVIASYEENKALEKFPSYVAHLVAKKLRRNHLLIAIGGGIIQDITCFLSATILRGVDWSFYPTTLLSQADSCIGSKSSINSGAAKNILGTFTPPKRIYINVSFLDTLTDVDVRSGIGEMLKAHIIDGPESFDKIAADYEKLRNHKFLFKYYIKRSLDIKKNYIEIDEFDKGPRNKFNYGHSFGHAIEAATDFKIPHGIAVTIGMDMANFISAKIGVGREADFDRMHPTLKLNYKGFESHVIPIEKFMAAISKDKKNIGSENLTLILPGLDGYVFRDSYANNEKFLNLCKNFLNAVRMQA